MNIVRKIHDQFRVKTLAGSTLQSPTSTSDSTGSGNTYVTITGGSLGGGGLSEADRSKLNSIEQGAQVNQDAFSKVLLETTNREQEQQTTTSSSIIANIPSDTANIRLIGNYPIKVSLESVSLFNYNTVTTTGDIVASYNVSYNKDGNIVIDYVSGTLFSTTDIEIIRIQHREETLATYNNTQFECTESEGTIIQFIIPYQGTDFSSIQFCRYETSSSESTEGTETVRELSVITELPVSPTKQQIITLSDTNANYWKYEEDENGNRYLWTDCNVYSTKEVSAYGKAEGQEMPTILNLSQLQDVALTNLSNNQVLVYNASSQKWVNIDANNLGISADNLKTLTITVNGTSYTYNPASSNQSINITTITLDDILPYISNKLDREEFFKWFTINYDSDNNVTSIQANYDFYSIKGISAYGLGDIGGITRTTLQSLDDVSLSNLAVDNMLAYNGSKWVNIPMSQVRGATSWADLENKPTTISGFGITDAYTKTEVNTKISEVSSKVTELSSSKADATIQVIAGDGLTGGGNLQQDITISLQNLNSTGTYYKVTVDAYGRVTSGISQLTIADIQNLQTQLDSKLNISDFNTWFTIIYNTDGTIKNIRANYDFYSVGEVSAYGIGDEEKKTYTTLAELNDVQLTNVKETDVLVYNGTKWINVDQSTIKGAQSWVDIQNKPTTISGFGIVDAYTKTEIDNKLSPINSSITSINSSINTINTNVSDLSSSLSSVSTKLNNFLEGSDTDTIINKWKELEAFLAGYTQTQTLADLLSVKANSSIQIIAGTGLVGGGNLTANRTISLSTSGVSAGTYTKVTVDTYGRVTSGSTLSATDIPDLDWSKITSGKPTTLAGYGITDGVNNITFAGSGNAITAVTISNHLLTFTKGETFLPKSTFDDLFEKVNVGTTSNPVYAIKAKYHLYSVGEVSAYEFGEAGGTGVSSLEELIDVQLTNLVADSILKYNGTKWINIPITEVKGATSWNEIEGKPSTFTPSAHTHAIADITDISTKYVSINATQTVSGLKTFTSTVKYQPTYYSYNAEDIEYRTTSGTLFGGIGAVHNGSSISYFYIGKGSTPWDTKDGLTIGDELGFKGHTVWHSGNTIIPTVPTKLSAFKNDSGYISGITKAMVESVLTGNITSHTHAYINRNFQGTGITNIPFTGKRFEYGILRDDTSNPTDVKAFDSYCQVEYINIPWVTDNFGGQIMLGANSGKIGYRTRHNGTWNQIKELLHQLNYTDYTVKKDGTGANGTWGISITGNAATATALTTSAGSATLPTYFSSGKPVACTASSVFSNLSNSGNSLSITVAGQNRTLTVNYSASAGNADTLDGLHASSFLLRARMTNPSNGTSYHGAIPFPLSLKSAGFPVYTDPEFASGNNSVGIYNNKSNGTVTISRIADNQGSANSSGYILQISTTSGEASPGRGGFHQNIQSRQNAVFAQIFRAKIPIGFSVVNAENGMGNGYTTFWLTDTAGTGKWEWYIRITICGSGGNYSGGGHVYLNGSGAVTWYLAYCNVIDLTKGNYDGLRTLCADKLQTARTLWGQSFDGTGNISGSLYNTGTITPSATHTYNIGSSSLVYERAYVRYIDTDTNYYLRICAQGNEAITVKTDGCVGIGVTSPVYKLDVNGTIHTTSGINAGDQIYAASSAYPIKIKRTSAYGALIQHFSSNQGTNCWLSGMAGSYEGNVYGFYYSTNAGNTDTKCAWIDTSGNFATIGGVTAKASSSDIRLKTDISNYDALSIIRKHRSVKYHWNDVAKANSDVFKDDDWHYGLIAQEMQKDMPQMVSDVFKDYLVINYERLIPICWKGLQEVDDEVTKLKKRVKQLEKRLQKYESTEVFYAKGND